LGFLGFCERHPQECVQVPDNGPAKETPALLDLVRKTNLAVNREIEPMSDLTQYGEEEYWTYPKSGKGDCEDYVLLKRRRLIAQGVPPEALLIATVTTKAGEGHAILVLRTDKNDYVLNNLTDAVLPWTETDFQTWRLIASPGNPFVWHEFPKTGKRQSPMSDLALKQQQDAPRQAVNADGGDNVTRRPLKSVIVKPL
jgi:predicted transglutaminase-like cysteine proteinase